MNKAIRSINRLQYNLNRCNKDSDRRKITVLISLKSASLQVFTAIDTINKIKKIEGLLKEIK